jgi:hypothetical protein
MIKIEGHEIFRSGTKVGFIEGDRIRSHDGKLLGYFSGNYVYDHEGHKTAYINGDYLCSESSDSTKVSLDKVNENIVGGLLPEIGKCAVYTLVGI